MRARFVGWAVMLIGIVVMASAAGMSVEAPGEPGIANNDLIAQRLLGFMGGGFAFIAGAIWLAAADVVLAIKQSRTTTE